MIRQATLVECDKPRCKEVFIFRGSSDEPSPAAAEAAAEDAGWDTDGDGKNYCPRHA
jgi:hypothetical protein